MTLLFELALFIVALVAVIGIATKGRFFRSVSNRIRDTADQANDAIRDPAADGRIAILDAKAEVQKLKDERRDILVEVTSAKAELKDLQEEEEKWDKLAKLAGAAQAADDVRTALTKKKAVSEEIKSVQEELAEYQNIAEEMNNAISSREAEISEAESSSKRLIKSIKLDKFRQRNAADKLGENNGTSNSLKQLRDDAKKARNKAVALEEEARIDAPTLTLEARYSANPAVTDEDIKAYMQ